MASVERFKRFIRNGSRTQYCKKIIDDHKGATIKAYNEDKETVFEITFLKVDFNKNIVKCIN